MVPWSQHAKAFCPCGYSLCYSTLLIICEKFAILTVGSILYISHYIIFFFSVEKLMWLKMSGINIFKKL